MNHSRPARRKWAHLGQNSPIRRRLELEYMAPRALLPALARAVETRQYHSLVISIPSITTPFSCPLCTHVFGDVFVPSRQNRIMHINGDVLEQDCIVSDRGGIVENTHRIHAAIVDSSGKLLFSIGNPSRVTLLRSAAKPAQALAIVETGALEKFGFDDLDLALMCASHNSEERHLARARAMLQKISATEDDLQCGGHPSISPEIAYEWIKSGVTPTAVYNNCSGKHAGMLAGAKAIGAELRNYHHLDHPMQQRVKQVTEDLCQGDAVR
jgi:hypothetical protein